MTPRERSEQVPWSERGMKTIPQPLDLPRDVHPAPGPSQASPCPPWTSWAGCTPSSRAKR